VLFSVELIAASCTADAISARQGTTVKCAVAQLPHANHSCHLNARRKALLRVRLQRYCDKCPRSFFNE